jgi:27-O-demethylrifamycin SV methyltransferase
MVLCDIIRRREIPFRELRDRVDDFVTLRESFGEARMDPLESYAALARANGLDVEALDDLTEATLPTFDRWRANLDTHRAEAIDALGADGVDGFARSCDILEAFWKDGTLGYGLMVAAKPAP